MNVELKNWDPGAQLVIVVAICVLLFYGSPDLADAIVKLVLASADWLNRH